MEEQILNLDDYLGILKRRKWQLILPILVLIPIAVVVALHLPAVYKSEATILIEQQEIPTDLIRTTVSSFADQRIQVIKQRVMTVANLGDIIEKYDLYPEIRRKTSLNAAVGRMRNDVNLNMISADVVDPRSGSAKEATIAFSLSFSSESPATAQKVTNEMVSLFMAENLRQREAAVEEASLFLREEANKLANRIRELDAALADFKEEHRDNLPEFFALNRELMQRAEEQLRDNDLAIRSLEEQQLLLETQLSQLDPTLTIAASGNGQTTLSPQAKLRALEADYAGIASRYAPTHPDRIAMEREMGALRGVVGDPSTDSSRLAALQRERAYLADDLAVTLDRYSASHPDAKRIQARLVGIDAQLATARASGFGEAPAQTPQNPAFLQLQARLEGIKLEIKGLAEAKGELRRRIQAYEQRLIEAPDIERQYKDLTRGYDNAVAKFQEVKAKQLEAELAQALETERKGERFTLIEPPALPDEPVEPNRPAILMLGLVGAFGAGFGHLALRELMDKGLHGARAVQTIVGIAPLAVIPYIQSAADHRRRSRRRIALASAAVFGTLAGIAILHWFVGPLDLLWFSLLRRLEAYLPTTTLAPGIELLPWNV